MPINYKNYHPKWTLIVRLIRKRSGNKCEGSPKYPDCRVANHKAHPVTGSMVVLTTAHVDHVRENNRFYNLRHWCQRCHLSHDIWQHVNNRRYGRDWKERQIKLKL